MSKRVYFESVKKWAIKVGLPSMVFKMNNKLLITIIIGTLLLISTSIVTGARWYGTGNDTTESNLVLHIPCEGDFRDRSGNGNDGTQSGGVSITRGVKGRACEFDGVNDIVDLPITGVLNEITVSAWVKPIQSKDYNAVYAKDNTYTHFMFVAQDRVRVGGIPFTNNSYSDVGTVPLNEWTHIAYTYNSTQLTVYVNGKQNGIPTNNTGTIDIGSTSIGYAHSGNYFNGSIDEIRIYNTSLSASEIASLYNSTKSYHVSIKTTPELGLIDETGLIFYSRFNSQDGCNSTHCQEVKNGWVGELKGTTFPTKTNEGRFSEAYYYSGDNDQDECISYGHHVELKADKGEFTATCWVKTNLTGNSLYRSIISNKRTNAAHQTGAGWFLDIDSSERLHMGWGNITPDVGYGQMWFTNYQSTGAIDNQWHLVGGMRQTINSTHSNYSLIYDGVITSYVDDLSYNLSDAVYGTPLVIGQDGVFTYEPMLGYIDECRVYNRSLSATEVLALYEGAKSNYISIKTTPTEGLTDETGLVGHWTFDSKDGSNSATAVDTSGQGNDGTVTGATFTNEGRFKEAYSFDGNDQIVMSNNAFPTSPNGSISLWLYQKDATGNNRWFSTSDTGGIGCEHRSYSATSGTTTLLLVNSSCGTGLGQGYSQLSNNAVWNKWEHSVWTWNYDGTHTTVKSYLNGVYQLSQTMNGDIKIPDTDVRLGEWAGSYFNGYIDEVRLYNYTLSASEVADLYNGTKSNYISFASVIG